MRTVILRGEFRSTVTRFNDIASEITIFGDVSYNGEEYANLPLVRLHIEHIDPDEDDVIVNDEYSSFLPYLKPIKAFREAVGLELHRLNSEMGYPADINLGIKEYLKELRSFSEIKSLVREVKSRVNRLRPEKADPAVIRKIFDALEENPSIDNRFIVRIR